MDNITHSLTGAVAAKIIETSKHDALPEQKSVYRTVFWLTVICANLPDIDVLFNVAGDPFFSINNHRGITHSLLFAPVLAFLPAIVAYAVTSVKNLKLLWMTALIGVYLHIFFDLITAFGTQLFAPLSAERYSLDWMFIIDPLFTGILAILLFLGKRFKQHARAFALAGGLFAVSYLVVEMVSHGIAVNRVTQTAKERGIAAERISVLAQPLSIFRWMGLMQASDGVYQTHFSLFDNPEPIELTRQAHADDEFVQKALATDEAHQFMQFARHPLIRSSEDGEKHIVEMRDMQFSFDPKMVETIANALGVTESERRLPFVLVFEFSREGELLATKFNR